MLQTKIHNLTLKNPVMTASGTFGYGEEFADFIDLNRLGGIIVKGTTGERRQGNLPSYGRNPVGNAQRRRTPERGRRDLL